MLFTLWLYFVLYFALGLCQNRLSSICTACTVPPRMIGCASNVVLHTSRSHWYTSIAVLFDTSASWTASPTGYCRAHICISSIHCCNVILDFWKKLPSRTLVLVLHCGHHQLYWSDTSLRGCSRIGMLHLCALNQFVVFKCIVFLTENSLCL